MKDTERHSSKGNQLKWNPANTETWYKADYIGYEGLTEYMVSHLLMHSTLSTTFSYTSRKKSLSIYFSVWRSRRSSTISRRSGNTNDWTKRFWEIPLYFAHY